MRTMKSFLLEGHERTLKLKRNIIGIVIFKGLGILFSFLMVPITINYLNPSEYGIWLTINSILAWVYYFDIGIGNGLRNKLGEALVDDDLNLGQSYVSTSYAFLFLISLLLFVLFLVINPFLNWAIILNLSTISPDQLSLIITCGIFFFFLQFVFKLIGTILIVDQRPSEDALLNFLGGILSFAIVYCLTLVTDGSLLYVVLTFSAIPPLIYFFASIHLFKRRYFLIKPKISAIKFDLLRGLLGLGMKFFVIQLSGLLVFSSSSFLIIRMFGPESVTEYNIAYKFFYVVILVFSLITAPLWSAFTNAYVKREFDWIKNIVNKMLKIWICLSVLSLLMLLIAPSFYSFWVGNNVIIPFSLSLSMCLYVILFNLHVTYINIINGTSKIFIQFIHAIVSIILYIPIAIFLCNILGVSGVVYASILILLPLPILSYIQYKKIISNKAFGIWNK